MESRWCSPRRELSPPHQSYFRLFTLGLDGGLPEPLPMPRAYTGTLLGRREARRVRGSLHGDVSGMDRGERMASLPGRPHAPHQRDEPRRPLRHEAAVDRQQRLVPRVDREHRVLPVRPHVHHEPVLVQRRHEGAEAAHASRRLRHRECDRRTGCGRLRAGRLRPPGRCEDRPVTPAEHRGDGRPAVGARGLSSTWPA